MSLMKTEWAVRRLLERYCRCVDDNDHDAVPPLFTDDAVLHFGDERLVGREAIRAYFRKVHGDGGGPPYGVHLLGNCIIEVVGDGEVTASTDFVQVWRTGTGPGANANAVVDGAFRSEIPVAGRYEDRLRRGDDGEWRIAERTGSLYAPNPFTAAPADA